MAIKYIRVMSDLHLEHAPYGVEPLDTDHETLLILAGDCITARDIYEYEVFEEPSNILADMEAFMESLRGRFAAVVAIAGNHEYYDMTLCPATDDLLREFYREYGATFLQNETAVFEQKGKDVVVFGSTAWSDFKDGNPHIMLQATEVLNDYEYILHPGDIAGMDYLKPYVVKGENESFRDALNEHLLAIEDEYGLDYKDKITSIVVTHHAPSAECIHPKYQRHSFDLNLMNWLYVNTGLYEYFTDYDIDFWFHGHMHEKVDREIYDTRVIANPRGYHKQIRDMNVLAEHKDTPFEPTMLIEIS